MGSSGEDHNKDIGSSVGGLVWVRRKNGSWWPGKILGPEELPEGCVATPRSGTPVKLLGREDASVDWYNLEKPKRVKAFHCGEYDNCIEKAKASASDLTKKTVKYARRKDAILDALKLESALLGKDAPDFSSTPDSQESEDVIEVLSSSDNNSDSDQELSESGLAKEESKQCRTPNESEDDGAEGVKRMRGLEDLGMAVTSSLRRKRSQVAHVHEFLKRKNKNRTLTKVLECTKMFDMPHVAEEKHSAGLHEQNESGSASSGTANAADQIKVIEKGTSDWQSKGKRNSRPRKVDPNDDHETYGGGVDPESSSGNPTRNVDPGLVDRSPLPQRLLPYRQSRFTVNPKYSSSDFSLPHHIAGSGLYDVMINVKTCYEPQHVPYVSLMSELTGHPITGHSVTIDVLNDGSFSELDYNLSEDKTSNVGVGRVSEQRPPRQRPSKYRRSFRTRKSRRNGFMSKKVRKLSSLTGSHRREEKKKLSVAESKGPAVACVPIKVVFSRINAALMV